MDLIPLALAGVVKGRARALGFSRVAIGPAEPPQHGAAFERWLAAGYGATMAYLGRGRADRLDPARLLPGVRSAVAVALSHGDGRGDDPSWAPVARYARGRDYHEVMRPRLHELAAAIREAGGAGTLTRVSVDTSAVLEREVAARAGLGWIGKNTNLLSSGLGSYFLIGIVLTTAEIAWDERVTDRCGTCTACLDACPTGAFATPYVLDARRCISYLTIEHRGDIPEELCGALHGWIFGCDVCQEVCPWNRKVAAVGDPALTPETPFEGAQGLLGLDEAAFRARFRASALRRSKRTGLLRNAALALAEGEGGELALRVAAGDADEVVRRAARRALRRRP